MRAPWLVVFLTALLASATPRAPRIASTNNVILAQVADYIGAEHRGASSACHSTLARLGSCLWLFCCRHLPCSNGQNCFRSVFIKRTGCLCKPTDLADFDELIALYRTQHRANFIFEVPKTSGPNRSCLFGTTPRGPNN